MASYGASDPAFETQVDRARKGVSRIAEGAVWKAASAINKIGKWLEKKLNQGIALATGRRPLFTAKGVEARAPIVHRIERNPRTDDATVASHIMHAVRGVTDPKTQEKNLQTLDINKLRLLNRHANHIGGERATPPPDAATRRACNAVHEAARKRLGNMAAWSGNPADRVPSAAERDSRLVSDMMRSRSPERYAKDCTPKERQALKKALASELRNSTDGRDRTKVQQALRAVDRAGGERDKPAFAPPGMSGRGNPAPAVVRAADRAVGGGARAASRPEPAMAR